MPSLLEIFLGRHSRKSYGHRVWEVLILVT